MKKKNLYGYLFVVLLSVFSAYAVDTPEADKVFVMKAAQGGMTEVKLGQLAVEKASSQEVKNFGAHMVSDHSTVNDTLKSLAISKGLVLPDKVNAVHQATIDRLSVLSGADFDKAYVEAMIKAHRKDDKLFSQEASSGKDMDLKNFASKTDETIKMHLKMIEDIQSKM